MPILTAEPESFPDDLFERPWHEVPWQLVYVRSRREKVLARALADQGVPYFLPQWSKCYRRRGRRFESSLPLFPGYVFFRGEDPERRLALRSNVIVRTLRIPDQAELHRELQALRSLREAGLFLAPHRYLEPGDPLEIKDGPFIGFRGTVLRENGKDRLVVSISFLSRSVAAEVDRERVEPVGDFWQCRMAQALSN